MRLQTATSAPAATRPTARRGPDEPVGVSWLITARWTIAIAGIGAAVAGRGALQADVPLTAPVICLVFWTSSNLWLMWRVRGLAGGLVRYAGLLVCADVTLFTWLLLESGGVLNPATVFYLVEIVVAALVLGRLWTWIVASLCVAGYATLYVAPTDAVLAALAMHPEIAVHMRGMWLAFALTALLIAVLVARLVLAIERRDAAIAELRERSSRTSRAASLATLAAGAAHELSTPLATIAVTAHELERALVDRGTESELAEDARLIRTETDRCRKVLEDMAGQAGESPGEPPRQTTIGAVIDQLRERLSPADRRRLHAEIPGERSVYWPTGVVVRALWNLVTNAMQASPSSSRVRLTVAEARPGLVSLTVADAGEGMTEEQLSRAGEPFFTTKPAGAGTGLGLFVARSSVEQLGGRLSIASVPGRGTTVVVSLPSSVLGAEPGAHG
jgi:two-component system sensor histidine kinase RegB